MDKLQKIKDYAKAFDCYDISAHVFDNPKFATWSGSGKPDQHHYGDGGLLDHTFEVIQLCLTNARTLDEINNQTDFFLFVEIQTLFLAALFHDVGKIWDYEKIDGIWRASVHRRDIHHISRSGIVWSRAIDLTVRDFKNIEQDVLHAILSHHQLREWGSPIMPRSKVAWILHLCDSMSARVNDCDTNNLIK